MTALVTGGGGFLGGAIVRRLIERGDSVRSFSRGDYPELKALGVDVRSGDIADANALTAAAAGCDVVYHVAAKPGIWGKYAEYHRVNVDGTKAVLEACRRNRIARLVHTSSPSVVFDGTDMEGVDESVPYPDHYDAHYPKTKAEAERLVLSANGSDLATVALRPHLIWGPGDNHLVPRLIARAKAGQLRRIGKANKKVDSVFIDNAAEAHILAGDSLSPDSPHAGRAYFISNGEPLPLWDLVNGILAAANLPPVTRTIPTWLAVAAGMALETSYGLLNIESEPRMTRFLARELATAHWFDISAAARDFGYRPQIRLKEGLLRLRTWLSDRLVDDSLSEIAEQRLLELDELERADENLRQ